MRIFGVGHGGVESTVLSALTYRSLIMQEERMLKWFSFDHLPEPLEPLQEMCFPFRELARTLCQLIEPGPERTVALRKLLEARDAAVRAKLHPGG